MKAAVCAALLDGTDEEIEAAKAKLSRAKRDAARKKALNIAKRSQAAAEAAAATLGEPDSAPASAPSSRGSSRSSDGAAPCVPRNVKTSLAHNTALALRERSLSNSSAESRRRVVKSFERVEQLADMHSASEGPAGEVDGTNTGISQGKWRGFTGRPARRSPRDRCLTTVGSDVHRFAATRATICDLDPPVTELVMGVGDSDELAATQAQTNASFTPARVLHTGDDDPLLEMVGSCVGGMQSSQPSEPSAKDGENMDSSTSWNPDSSLVHKRGADGAFMPSNGSDANVRRQRLQHFQQNTRKHVILGTAPASTKLRPNESRASEIRAPARATRALSGPPKGNTGGGFGISSKAKTGARPRGSSRSGSGRQHASAARNGIVGTERTVTATGFRGTKKSFPAAGGNGGTVSKAVVGLAGRCLEVERAGLELRSRTN